ncbi:MAG: hypothetical protein WC666_00320 [Candidatus Paceibacterota bacterium]|jgi:beta-lactamase superfamily II metal-dependent hydrolase
MSIKSISKPLLVVAATTAVASSLGAYIWKIEARPPILEIYVFVLSSGRSMFIRTPEDKRVLIDGGSNSEIVRKLTDILPFYSRRIDKIIATNTEGKNISGLIDIIERYDVSEAYISGINLEVLGIASSSDQIFSTFTDTLQREVIKTQELIAGDNIHLDNKTDLHVFFPVHQDRFAYSKASAPEILFSISLGATSVTFLGNASNKVQKFIASTSPIIDETTKTNEITTDILIVSHSALPVNISPVLMDKLRPKYLIYSKLIRNTSTKSVKDSKTASLKKKEIKDPLGYVLDENRFNLKERGAIKITSDGIGVSVADISGRSDVLY